jgi:hypothetical protein
MSKKWGSANFMPIPPASGESVSPQSEGAQAEMVAQAVSTPTLSRRPALASSVSPVSSEQWQGWAGVALKAAPQTQFTGWGQQAWQAVKAGAKAVVNFAAQVAGNVASGAVNAAPSVARVYREAGSAVASAWNRTRNEVNHKTSSTRSYSYESSSSSSSSASSSTASTSSQTSTTSSQSSAGGGYYSSRESYQTSAHSQTVESIQRLGAVASQNMTPQEKAALRLNEIQDAQSAEAAVKRIQDTLEKGAKRRFGNDSQLALELTQNLTRGLGAMERVDSVKDLPTETKDLLEYSFLRMMAGAGRGPKLPGEGEKFGKQVLGVSEDTLKQAKAIPAEEIRKLKELRDSGTLSEPFQSLEELMGNTAQAKLGQHFSNGKLSIHSIEDLQGVVTQLELHQEAQPDLFKDPFIAEKFEVLKIWADVAKGFGEVESVANLEGEVIKNIAKGLLKMANSDDPEMVERGWRIAASLKMTRYNYDQLKQGGNL